MFLDKNSDEILGDWQLQEVAGLYQLQSTTTSSSLVVIDTPELPNSELSYAFGVGVTHDGRIRHIWVYSGDTQENANEGMTPDDFVSGFVDNIKFDLSMASMLLKAALDAGFDRGSMSFTNYCGRGAALMVAERYLVSYFDGEKNPFCIQDEDDEQDGGSWYRDSTRCFTALKSTMLYEAIQLRNQIGAILAAVGESEL